MSYDPTPELSRAAEAAARARASTPPEWPPIPPALPEGQRQLRCPEPGCNRRFIRIARYELHWRVAHCDPGWPARPGDRSNMP